MLPPFLRLLAPIIFLPSRLPFVISSFDRDFQRSMVIRYPRRRIQRFLRLSRLRIEIGSSSNFRRSSGEIIFFFRFLSISFDDRLSRVVPLLWIVSRIIFDPLCHCRHRERERERDEGGHFIRLEQERGGTGSKNARTEFPSNCFEWRGGGGGGGRRIDLVEGGREESWRS